MPDYEFTRTDGSVGRFRCPSDYVYLLTNLPGYTRVWSAPNMVVYPTYWEAREESAEERVAADRQAARGAVESRRELAEAYREEYGSG